MNKIVIIEYDEIIRNELKIFLEKYGYIVNIPNDFDNIIKLYFKRATFISFT